MQQKEISPKQIAEALELLDKIAVIGEAIRKKALEMLHEGVEIEGWEAAFTPQRRQWVSAAAAEKLMLEVGLNASDAYEAKLISPAEAEKLLKKHGLLPTDKRSARYDFTDNPLLRAVNYSDGNPTMKRSVKKDT